MNASGDKGGKDAKKLEYTNHDRGRVQRGSVACGSKTLLKQC